MRARRQQLQTFLWARRGIFAVYGTIGLVWWWLATSHDSAASPTPLDGLDLAMVGMIVVTLGLYWVVTLVIRRDWPLQTLGLHAVIVGDVVLYGVLVLAGRQGWIETDTEVWGDLLRASVWVGGLVLAWELVRWMWVGLDESRRTERERADRDAAARQIVAVADRAATRVRAVAADAARDLTDRAADQASLTESADRTARDMRAGGV